MTSANQAVAPALRAAGPFMMLTAAPVSKTGTVESTGTPTKDAQGYIDRVRNYIPLEVIAFFIFANSMVSGDDGQVGSLWGQGDDGGLTMTLANFGSNEFVALASFVVALIGTVIYVKMATDKAGSQTWKLHAAMSCLAFAVWAYALKAEAWDVLGIPIEPSISGFLLGTFTLFSGLIVPVRKDATAGDAPTT